MRDIRSILDTELRDFSGSLRALAMHLSYGEITDEIMFLYTALENITNQERMLEDGGREQTNYCKL